MPAEILYSNLDELSDRLKKLNSPIIECRLKINKENIKLKIRTKRRLYTAVLTPEKTGIDMKSLEERAREMASLIGCEDVVVIQ